MNSSNINFDTKEDSLNDDYQALLTVKPEDNSLDFEQRLFSLSYDLTG